MRIKLTADSTCDLSPELYRKLHVEVVPLTVVKGEESFRDGVDIGPEDIFQYARETGRMCKTAAVNREEYEAVFSRYAKEYDAVIHVNISAEFSSCYQNACLAAEGFPNVYVVDSRNLSTGSGHLVMEAWEMARAGIEPAEIAARLRGLAEKVEASFVIDTLEYLHKGGRCSSVAALGANLLKLKPCIEVRDGKMLVGKKYRGSFERCIGQYVKERLEGRDDISPKRIFITHTGCAPELVDSVRKALKRQMDFDEVIETRAGCTVTSHCGPGTLGILFLRK